MINTAPSCQFQGAAFLPVGLGSRPDMRPANSGKSRTLFAMPPNSMSLHAFIDESGAFGSQFDKPGVGTHFVVGGIICEDADIEGITEAAQKIAELHFAGSEIKSSKVGKNLQRRLEIIDVLLQSKLHIYAMVFDKTKLTSRGLKFKTSFYKYLSRLAYAILYCSFPNLSIHADEHGSKEFMDSFRNYIGKHFTERDLFGNAAFGFEDSKNERLTQVADLCVGSIAQLYDAGVPYNDKIQILNTLRARGSLLPIHEWPPRKTSFVNSDMLPLTAAMNADDQAILDYSVAAARDFIEKNRTNRSDYVPEQVSTVDALLFQVQYGDPSQFLLTPTLVDAIKGASDTRVDKKNFGRCIIGPIRDAGVLVTSHTTGYKLVTGLMDLKQFTQYYSLFLLPMLDRLGKYRDLVLTATRNRIDILDENGYEILRKFYDKE